MFSLLWEKKPNFDENKSQSVAYNALGELLRTVPGNTTLKLAQTGKHSQEIFALNIDNKVIEYTSIPNSLLEKSKNFACFGQKCCL